MSLMGEVTSAAVVEAEKKDESEFVPPMLRPDWPGLAAGIDPGTLVEVTQLKRDDSPPDESE